MEILERRREERENVIANAKKFAQGFPRNSSIFLVGSYARGDFNVWSDVDLVIVCEFQGNVLERLKSLDFPAGYEVIPLTIGEFKSMLKRQNPIMEDIVKHRIVLRDDFHLVSYLVSNLN